MEQIMDDTDVPTSLLRLYHLSRQIKAVLTQTQSVQACNILLDKRLGVFEASLDSSSLKELHEAIVVLQQRHDEEAAHRAQIEDELAFFKQSLHDKEEQNSAVQQLIQETANENRALQQSLLETVKENKSIKQKLNKFQTDLARVMLNMESLQGGQEEKNFQALNLKVNSAEKANGITSEQIDAVQQRMVFLEEENIKVKTSVAQLSAKLQAHPENNPKTSRVREATSTVLSPSKSRVILAAKHVKRLQRDKTKLGNIRAKSAKSTPKTPRLSRTAVPEGQKPTQIIQHRWNLRPTTAGAAAQKIETSPRNIRQNARDKFSNIGLTAPIRKITTTVRSIDEAVKDTAQGTHVPHSESSSITPGSDSASPALNKVNEQNFNPARFKIIGSPHVIYSDHRREQRLPSTDSGERQS